MDYTDDFENDVWKPYPMRGGKKVGKKPAFAQWQKLTKEQQRIAIADIGKRNRNRGWGKYIRDCQRYLRDHGWDDEWQPGVDEDKPRSGPIEFKAKESEHQLTKWEALANRIGMKYLRHAGQFSDERLKQFLRTKNGTIAELSGPLDEEMRETGTNEAVITFVETLLKRWDIDLCLDLSRKVLSASKRL